MALLIHFQLLQKNISTEFDCLCISSSDEHYKLTSEKIIIIKYSMSIFLSQVSYCPGGAIVWQKMLPSKLLKLVMFAVSMFSDSYLNNKTAYLIAQIFGGKFIIPWDYCLHRNTGTPVILNETHLTLGETCLFVAELETFGSAWCE